MKILLHFKNNRRIVAEKRAIVSPHPMSELEQEIDLSRATEEEVVSLINNPHQDNLLAEIQKRK